MNKKKYPVSMPLANWDKTWNKGGGESFQTASSINIFVENKPKDFWIKARKISYSSDDPITEKEWQKFMPIFRALMRSQEEVFRNMERRGYLDMPLSRY